MGLLDTALADGRCWSRVGDCFEVTRKPPGLRVADYKAVPFVPMEAIPQGGQYEPRYDQKPGADITSGTYFERGDLLIAKITPSFENGKQAWVKRLPAPFGYATTEVIPLRPTAAGYDRRLLFFYLLHPEIRSYVSERMEGSTGRQRVPEQVLLDLPYPKLPPDDQQAIADTLERVTLQVDLEEHSARTAAELKRAAMRELFTRGLRGEPQKETEIGPVPESWGVVELSSLCLATDQVDLTSEADRIIHYIDVSSVSRDSLQVETTTEYRLKDAPSRARKRVRNGDVIFATIRPTLLRAARIDEALDNQVCSTAFCVLRTADPELLGKYVFYAVQRPEFLELLERIETGASYPAVTDRQVKAQPIPLPTPDEQREIVAVLDAIDRKIELHRKKRAVLEELFKALLHKLMTGEIRVADLDLSALEPLHTPHVAA
ncbi:restriction endonuclease subunit S [Methylocaldum szegediense]|uniref:restriction endonuclease subunit S n=1 Tax=Methylocaldum szegediense TaxID=73780 RepID=UPI0012EC702C|nr:restriction endonuclease subunit S [Methylocaldum szegediense]